MLEDGTATETAEETPPVEDDNTPPAEGEGTPDGGGEETPGKTLSQDEVNAIVQKRLKRERKAWEDERAEAERRAKMDAEERAKLEREEAEKAANERVSLANQRVIRADAKGIASELGVKPERVSAVLDLADLSDVEVSDETNEADTGEIRGALSAVLEKYPEFRVPEYGTAPGNRKHAETKAPTGMDAEIQAALDAGDYRKAERLHAERLAKQNKLNHPT